MQKMAFLVSSQELIPYALAELLLYLFNNNVLFYESVPGSEGRKFGYAS